MKLESEQNEQTFESVNWSARRIVSVNFYDCAFKKVDLKQNELRKAKFSLPEAMSLLYAMDIEIGDGSER